MSGQSMLGFLVPAVVGLGAASDGLAQGVPMPGGPPPASGNADAGVLGPLLAVGVVVVVLLIVGVRMLDARRRRQTEALALEASLSDALLRDPRLVGQSVVTAVHLPLASGAPPRVEVRGEVTSPELRQATMRVVAQEVRRLHPAAEVEDRIFVAPPVLSHR